MGSLPDKLSLSPLSNPPPPPPSYPPLFPAFSFSHPSQRPASLLTFPTSCLRGFLPKSDLSRHYRHPACLTLSDIRPVSPFPTFCLPHPFRHPVCLNLFGIRPASPFPASGRSNPFRHPACLTLSTFCLPHPFRHPVCLNLSRHLACLTLSDIRPVSPFPTFCLPHPFRHPVCLNLFGIRPASPFPTSGLSHPFRHLACLQHPACLTFFDIRQVSPFPTSGCHSFRHIVFHVPVPGVQALSSIPSSVSGHPFQYPASPLILPGTVYHAFRPPASLTRPHLPPPPSLSLILPCVTGQNTAPPPPIRPFYIYQE